MKYLQAPLAFVAAGAVCLTAGPTRAEPTSIQRPQATSYYPTPGDAWERKAAEEVGIDAELLEQAVAFAKEHESTQSRDLYQMLVSRFAGQPDQEITGPLKDRGDMNGLILRHGYIVAEWGDTRRVDMTFSVTKSFLSTTAGLALANGLIRDPNDLVAEYVHDGGFDSPHNAEITWKHLLQQTSEWEGVLWDKPDAADRRRGRDRQLQQPGTFWEYNDVRVNRLALALLRLWRKPLPELLKERVMDPIGASESWVWHGYRNSDVVIDGRTMKSVSGGGHWGGGMWISSRDEARFGYLFLRRGRWKDQQLVPETWIDLATTPTDIRPRYGFMWWLNTDQEMWPSAPETSYAALGAGTNVIWIDPEHDLVVVVRWIQRDAIDGFLGRILAAVK